jgi:hypothetical protein
MVHHAASSAENFLLPIPMSSLRDSSSRGCRCRFRRVGSLIRRPCGRR